jgi:hypothetical protein
VKTGQAGRTPVQNGDTQNGEFGKFWQLLVCQDL